MGACARDLRRQGRRRHRRRAASRRQRGVRHLTGLRSGGGCRHHRRSRGSPRPPGERAPHPRRGGRRGAGVGRVLRPPRSRDSRFDRARRGSAATLRGRGLEERVARMSTPRTRAPRTLTQKLGSIVLGFESIVVFLAGLTVYGLKALPEGIPPWWGIVG